MDYQARPSTRQTGNDPLQLRRSPLP